MPLSQSHDLRLCEKVKRLQCFLFVTEAACTDWGISGDMDTELVLEEVDQIHLG